MGIAKHHAFPCFAKIASEYHRRKPRVLGAFHTGRIAVGTHFREMKWATQSL
jgi:hypothetical protein